MISLNYRDPRPIYEQLEEKLRRLILSGAIPEGERLPSVRELAGQLAINPNTIQRAYRELEQAGFIWSCGRSWWPFTRNCCSWGRTPRSCGPCYP